MMPEPPRRRPGGRTARTGQAVHEAVRQLLAERGRDGFTGRDVAERAGVHEATIYRRWGTLDNLVLDVAAEVARLNEQSPIPDTGSLREDLRQWGRAMAADLAPPDGLALLRRVLAARDGGGNGARGRSGAGAREAGMAGTGDQDRDRLVGNFLGARAAAIQQVLDRAAARGESPPGVTAVLDRFVAPIYLRAIFGYGDIDGELDVLVDNTLAGLPEPDEPASG
jgi:AcrR family transcriptional regulator